MKYIPTEQEFLQGILHALYTPDGVFVDNMCLHDLAEELKERLRVLTTRCQAI